MASAGGTGSPENVLHVIAYLLRIGLAHRNAEYAMHAKKVIVYMGRTRGMAGAFGAARGRGRVRHVRVVTAKSVVVLPPTLLPGTPWRRDLQSVASSSAS